MMPTPLTLDQLLTRLGDAQLLAATAPTHADQALPVLAVTSDSRAVGPGALFVAVQGGSFDGHRYLQDAVARGAAALVGTRSLAELRADGSPAPPIPYVQVTNARLALALIGATLYNEPSRALTVIGVTGTDGKTTTCTLIESILNVATRPAQDAGGAGDTGVITTVGARIRGVESETGLHVTTPDAPEVQRFLAAMREAGCTYAVVESTSHGLDQERVAAVEFDVAAVTNITHEHLDYHGTRTAYVQAKSKLFRYLFAPTHKLGVPRTAVLNADDGGSYGALLAALDEEARTQPTQVVRRAYGVRAARGAAQAAVAAGELAVAATEIVYSPQATHLQIVWWGGEFELATPLIGDFNVYNIVCAVTVALALGVTPAVIQVGVAEMQGVSGRMERIEAGQDFLALVDFAHSPASLERALQTLRPLVGRAPDGTPGRLIAVFGCAGLRDRAKRTLMGEISGRLADFTVITAEDPRTEDLDEINRTIADALRSAGSGRAYAVVPDRTAAIQLAVDLAYPGDVVAAFGKGHERSMCFGTVEYPWSDQAALRGALQRRLARG
jgi:UDP-N-acetylmuramoyl-L-alanyl-D-glutamate--2,6-diaminopimelate ligase